MVTPCVRIDAGENKLEIIPGSMGNKFYIVRGKGNPESFCSCSHRAGRRTSRGKAKRHSNESDMEAQTEGVECRKDIDDVMENQSDLVEVVHTLRQVICVKE